MLSNYRYKNQYPQPEILPGQYHMAIQRYQLQLPLPGYSIKIPFEQKPTRFLTVNRHKKQIDYLRDHIQHKCNIQQMHYQAKLEQMKRENEVNRMKLQKLLMQQPKHLFQIPDRLIDDTKSVSSNLENIALKRLYNHKNKYLMDSIDQVKERNSRSQMERKGDAGGEEEEEMDQEELKRKRQNQLDYIYKKNGAVNTSDHFGPTPLIKKQQERRIQKQKQKKEQQEWVQRVRIARQKKFLEDDKQSVDSSKPSQSSQQKKKKKKQEQIKKQKTQQNSQRGSQRGTQRGPLSNYQNSRINFQQNSGHNNNNTVSSQRNQRIGELDRITQRTPSRQEDISNISQFSRYADKKDIFNKDKPKANKGMDAIPEVDIRPLMQRRRQRGNWKV